MSLVAEESALAQATNAEQSTSGQQNEGAAASLMDDIVVTATKKTKAEDLQKVPISASAFGQDQLAALQFKSLESLTYALPNVQMDSVGTQKGIANFTIRGVAVNSSVVSIEPAVGTFIDGVYLGTNYAVNLDMFDVETVEVLRGPQGVLFGRNVTGGAVSVRTRRPDGHTRMTGKLSVESGLRGNGSLVTGAASVEGAIIPDKFFAKITALGSTDSGYFHNKVLNRNDGKTNTYFVRPSFVAHPTDSVDLTLVLEHGETHGDGPVSQNSAYADGFETAANFPGKTSLRYNSLMFETNAAVGDTGKITNILGYRGFKLDTAYGFDGSPTPAYHILYHTKQDQFSNELRYSDRFFDTVDFVTGLYYFTQDIFYINRDDLIYVNKIRDYGGTQKQESYGVFANADVDILEKLRLGFGARYSIDKKRVDVVTGRATPANQLCNFNTLSCQSAFRDHKTFNSFTPRAAISYFPASNSQLYFSYSKGFRAGGYNLRHSTPPALPGPFGDEQADALELGAKASLFNRRLKLNVAAFSTRIKDVQRQALEVTGTGTQLRLLNAGNVRIKGFEGDLRLKVADGTVLTGSLGYTDGKYTKVVADLTGDGIVDAKDLALRLPRLAKWTYGVGIISDFQLADIGNLTFQAQFDHRSSSAFTDSNGAGTDLPAFDNLFVNLSVSPTSMAGLKLSLYGKNLLDDQNTGLTANISAITGSIAKVPTAGRVFGAEASFSF